MAMVARYTRALSGELAVEELDYVRVPSQMNREP